MINTTLSSTSGYLGTKSCECVVRKHEVQYWTHLLSLAQFIQVAEAWTTSSHTTSYPRSKTKNTRKITVYWSKIWHNGGKDAWVMLQMMQLMSIQWERPSFFPAGATFLVCPRAVVQLLLQRERWSLSAFLENTPWSKCLALHLPEFFEKTSKLPLNATYKASKA